MHCDFEKGSQNEYFKYFKSTLLVGREGVTKKEYSCTLLIMLTILDVPLVHTRRVPVQWAVERDEIPYPYKVHDTTLRPLLNITIKSTIVVRSRSRSCGGGDICGTTPA